MSRQHPRRSATRAAHPHDSGINPQAFEFATPVGVGAVHAYVYDIGTYHYNWHDDIELLTVVTGRVEVATDGTRRVLPVRESVLLNSNQGHATLAVEPGSRALAVHFAPEVFAQATGGTPPRFTSAPRFPTDALTARLARLMLRDGDSAVDLLRTQGDAAWLAAEVIECFPLADAAPITVAGKPAAGDDAAAALDRVCAHIEAHFTERLTLAGLAKVAGYSQAYLSALFSQVMGMTCFEFLSRVRLRAATRQLAASDKLIGDIAFDTGFADAKALSTAFKATFGRTPSRYRAELAGHDEVAAIDAGFKKRFTARSNPEVYARLAEWAAPHRHETPVALARRLAALLEREGADF